MGHCPNGPDANCSYCVFPLLSTLISAGFAVCFLFALALVTGRIVSAAINKRLVGRVRALQVGGDCVV